VDVLAVMAHGGEEVADVVVVEGVEAMATSGPHPHQAQRPEQPQVM
jgi:hypothetical protein